MGLLIIIATLIMFYFPLRSNVSNGVYRVITDSAHGPIKIEFKTFHYIKTYTILLESNSKLRIFSFNAKFIYMK